ncbi:MAG: hypothetical protein MI892_20665 [Desulfobacterales bacterium]|nr:hypothetical protein [Desulfobacterales bacterium]
MKKTTLDFKPKGDLFTQVTASLPKPYFDLIRILVAQNKASTAEVVRYIICDYLRTMCPNLPEYHFDPKPGPGKKA